MQIEVKIIFIALMYSLKINKNNFITNNKPRFVLEKSIR